MMIYFLGCRVKSIKLQDFTISVKWWFALIAKFHLDHTDSVVFP